MKASEGETAQVQTGDACNACNGHLVVYSGHTTGALHVRYLRCWNCRAKPANNKVIVPVEEVAKRRSRICPNKANSSDSCEIVPG